MTLRSLLLRPVARPRWAAQGAAPDRAAGGLRGLSSGCCAAACRASRRRRRCSSPPRDSSSSSSRGEPLERALQESARRGASRDAAVGSDRLDPRRGERYAHPGGGTRSGEVRRRDPADAGGARARRCASSAPAARRSSPTAPSSPRSATTSPPRPMRSISIRSASCSSTATTATARIFKDALDKLGVDINVFRVGSFKSAVETYTRTNMSPEDREESLAYLNALWTSYQAGGHARAQAPADALDELRRLAAEDRAGRAAATPRRSRCRRRSRQRGQDRASRSSSASSVSSARTIERIVPARSQWTTTCAIARAQKKAARRTASRAWA